MIIVECIQGTEEWYQARCGIPTASSFSKIITSKGASSKSADKYMYRLAGEFITKTPEETYQSQAMKTGNEREDDARQLYEIINGVEVVQVGFCLTDDKKCGCSPDSLVGDEGMLEIKCPNIDTHVGYLLSGKLPTAYYQQVQGQLFVTGRQWCDFMSFYPGLEPMFVRVERHEGFIEKLQVEIEVLSVELKEIIKKII